MWGGGGGNVFLAFYAISNISRNKNLRKTILFHLMFSLCFFYAISISIIFILIFDPKGDGWWGVVMLSWEWFLQMVDREF